MEGTKPGRAAREKKAYDEDDVWSHSHRWHRRFWHVFESPNTLRHESVFDSLVTQAILGKKALEIGCGSGVFCRKLFDAGASYVLGVDVSEVFVREAQKHAVPHRVEFKVLDVEQPMRGGGGDITSYSEDRSSTISIIAPFSHVSTASTSFPRE